ncbi:hypothetical protein [Limibacillus sp. MBR-115]|jgi:serine/threonine protein phosphatase 1|uniref:hypothetical protein n=1 Tax=Limibacillus sp. MBR-115 TaxID=3156465 RepID=UPI003394A5DF
MDSGRMEENSIRLFSFDQERSLVEVNPTKAVTTNRQKFAVLKGGRRVWAVGSVHGEATRLMALHDILADKLQPGDQLVYLGNLIGRGSQVSETLDEAISFRRLFLSRPGALVCDLAYLRGSQEEMWQKMLQLQFATDPRSVLAWMLQQGVGATIEAYASTRAEAERAASGGVISITRWSGQLRQQMQKHPGHYQFFAALRRAAFTDDGALLFVHAGIAPERPLDAQKDTFWWGGQGFQRISEPYGNYRRVVRGFAADHPGLLLEDHRATLDAGCGFGGPLIAACLDSEGALQDSIEV